MQLLDLLRRHKPAETAPLASLLNDLNLEPFDTASVEHYKQEKKEATFRAVLPQGEYDWVQRTRSKVGFAYTPTPGPSIADPLGIASDEFFFLRSAMDGGWDLRFYYDDTMTHIPVAVLLRWRRMSLAEAVATIGVPDYVANKAAQILDRSPDAVIEVDSLESQAHNFDPFLVVKLGSEEFYVEVWGADEREFQH